MIELRLLGPQSILRSDGREFGSLPAQPKRFALLAFLAVGNGSLQRRDTIAAMFWPDLDQFAARRALRNTLYHLREALGDGVIATQGDDLIGVHPDMIVADVTQLRAAHSAGRFEEAVDLYRGDLLAGMHFSNAGEAFEEWLAAERATTVDAVLSSMRALSDRDLAAGNHGGAAYWASRACTLVPGDEALLRRAMELLEQSGDRGGALRRHEAYAKRLAAEFRAAPSAQTEELAKRIRTAPLSVQGDADAVVAVAHAPRVDSVPETKAASPPSNRARIRIALAAAALVVVVAGSWTYLRHRSPAASARSRVLVTVFDNLTGDSALAPIGRMTQDWLTQGIMRTNLVDVVDERVFVVQQRSGPVDALTIARRSGAGIVVSGSYYRSGDSLLMQAAVVNATTGRVLRVVGPIVAAARQPVSAIDALRSRVMTALASVVDLHVADDLANSGQLPTFDAYQAYVQGRDAFWHGDGRRAESLFIKSSHLDTSFASAGLAAAAAASNFHDCSLVDSLQRVLMSASRDLSRIDRITLEIAAARCRGRNEQMLQLTLERADLEPRVASVQLAAAAAALWANRPARTLAMLTRIDPETDLEWSSDSTHFAYWSGLTEALHLLGRHREELSAATRSSSLTPLNRAWLRGRALGALARPAETLALVDTILTLPAETANDIGLGPYTDGRPVYTATAGWVTVWIARELMSHGDSATARKVAARSYAWYSARPLPEREAPEERLVASWALDLMKSYSEAERTARALIAIDTSNIDYRGALAGPLAAAGDTAGVDSVDRWLARRTDARAGWSAPFYRARDAALMGRQSEAVARVREALDDGAWPLWVHVDPAFGALAAHSDMLALLGPRG